MEITKGRSYVGEEQQNYALCCPHAVMPRREVRTSSMLGKHSTAGLGLQTFKLF